MGRKAMGLRWACEPLWEYYYYYAALKSSTTWQLSHSQFASSPLSGLTSASSPAYKDLQLDRIVHQRLSSAFVLHLNCQSLHLIKYFSGSRQKETDLLLARREVAEPQNIQQNDASVKDMSTFDSFK